MKQFVATKAFIVHEGKVLLLRESSAYDEGANAGSWDVPGGRVEPGQHFLESLRREIKEETGLDVTVGAPFFVDEWHPVVKGEEWQIIGTYFLCEVDTDEVALSEDHDSYKWIEPERFQDFTLNSGVDKAFRTYLEQ